MVGLSEYIVEFVSSGRNRIRPFPMEIDIAGIVDSLKSRGLQEIDKNRNLNNGLEGESRKDNVGYYRIILDDYDDAEGIHFCNKSGTAYFQCYVSRDNYFSLPQFRVETYKLDKRMKPRSKFYKTCPKCGTKFSYTYTDENFDNKRKEYFVTCPDCNHKMYLDFKPYRSDKVIFPKTYQEFIELVEEYI